MDSSCSLEQRPITSTICRHTHATIQELPRVFGETFGALLAYLSSVGEMPVGPPFVAYHGLDLNGLDLSGGAGSGPQGELDLEIGFPVARPLPGRGDVVPGEIPAGTYATMMHTGPYEDVGPAYAALRGYAFLSGRQLTDVAYEMYFDPPETPPEKTRTLILLPVQERVEEHMPQPQPPAQ